MKLNENNFLFKSGRGIFKILTINTHKGLYKFNKLPFDIKAAPDIFLQLKDSMLASSDFSIAYLHNILIKDGYGGQHAEHVKMIFGKTKR